MKYIKFLSGVILLIPLFLTSCRENQGAQQPGSPPAAQVSAYQVKSANAAFHDEYPATVTALNQVEIRSEVSGYIAGINFKDGQHVSKGMKLYTLDQQQVKAAYQQAVANLNVAKANLQRAQQDADRYNELAKHDAIARQTLEHALADLQTAKMQVAAAESNVNGVQTNLRYSEIVAPFDGTIGISLVKMGSTVAAGQTLLNTISSDNPMAVDFSVDEKQIDYFSRLVQAKPSDKDSTFTILLPDQSIYPFPGHLSLLDRAVDPQTGTIKARLIIPNPKNILRAGLSCNVRVLNNDQGNSIVIPYKAVTEQMGEYSVFVINNNKAQQRKINTGKVIKDMVIVKSGLKPGEQVVTEGMQKLRDNSPVRITSAGTGSSNQ